jgi:zinc transport system substrate-binding protein
MVLMRHYLPFRATLPATLVAVGSLALTACSAFSSDEGATASDGAVTVAAAFYPLEFVASRVGGDLAEVTGLTGVGQEPHDLELSIAQTALLGDADLVVYEQALQPGVADSVEQNATGEALEIEQVVTLQPLAEEHADEEHADEEHADEEGHEHGDEDPHFWLDPVLMADLADEVAARLSEIDPDHADEYAANADGLVGELEALDQAYTDGLAQCERDVVVVSHDAFGYLARYGLDFHGIAGLSPEAEPTPADLAELQELIDAEGVTTVFAETLVPRELAETLANDAGVDTAVLDPIEGLSDETAGEDYLSIMESNLAKLREANGCQ